MLMVALQRATDSSAGFHGHLQASSTWDSSAGFIASITTSHNWKGHARIRIRKLGLGLRFGFGAPVSHHRMGAVPPPAQGTPAKQCLPVLLVHDGPNLG